MIIRQVDKPITVVEPKDYPEASLKEFVLIGRSNVGKSSFINNLLGRKNLAYTSQNPGKTQTINFYKVNERFYFVDVPGYGYAKVSKTQREAFGKMIEAYLTTRETLEHAFLLIDMRHNPTEDDIIMANYLNYYQIPFTIIATKSDKISNNKIIQHQKAIRKHLNIGQHIEIIPFSTIKSLNRDKVLNKIASFL